MPQLSVVSTCYRSAVTFDVGVFSLIKSFGNHKTSINAAFNISTKGYLVHAGNESVSGYLQHIIKYDGSSNCNSLNR